MAKTVVGRNLPLYKEEYNSTTTYDRYDVVLYDGSSYVSRLPNNQGNAITNTNYWQLLAKRGEFTAQQLEDFKASVVAESKTEMDDYTDDKKDELDTYTGTKKGELDTYEETKESELETVAETLTSTFNTNATQKTTDYNNNATEKTNTFNTNATTKIEAFNSNATTKTDAFDTNATEKTNTFNTNAESKTTDFNTNASTKTDTFNTNATDKTNAFNTNAENETTDFNDNATEKLDEYNQNASEKIQEYNENSATTDKAIELLAQEHYDTVTVEDESISVGDAEEFYGSINIKGRSYQDQDGEVSPDNVQEIENVIGDIEITANEETIVFPLQEGQRMYEGSYLADDGIHHTRRRLELAIADMNNSEANPGWNYVEHLNKDYQGFNSALSNVCDYLSNIESQNNQGIRINTLDARSILFLSRNVFGKTQTEWKNEYPDMIFVLEYTLQREEVEPYTVQQKNAYNKLKKILLQEGTNSITGTSGELNPILELTYKKIKEYTTETHEDEQDSKIADLQNTVQELEQNTLWNTTDQGTYIDVDDAAKYSKNKIAVVGKSWQATRSGKNLFNKEKILNMAYGSMAGTGGTQILEKNDYRGYYINCSAGDVFSISRASTINNRFGVTFTTQEPSAGVTCFRNDYTK